MRTIIILLGLSIVFAACTKDESISHTKNKNNTESTTLNLTNSNWFTTNETHSAKVFGYVYLSISGTTNADKVTIETYGDGDRSDFELILDSKKNFRNDSICISFTVSSNLPSYEFECSTVLKAIKGSDTSVVKLNSGKLKY
jgi:hypothetical protein